MRESVVAMVLFHGRPLYFVDRPDPHRALIEAAVTAPLKCLSALAEADALGRICPDQQELLDRVAMFRELAAESKCLASYRARNLRIAQQQEREANKSCVDNADKHTKGDSVWIVQRCRL